MVNKSLSCLCIIFIIYGCSNNSNTNKKYKITIDSVLFKVNDKKIANAISSSNFIFADVDKLNEEIICLANDAGNLFFFNIKENILLKKINLAEIDSTFINSFWYNSISGLCFETIDSIYIFQEKKISLIDINGKIKKRWFINIGFEDDKNFRDFIYSYYPQNFFHNKTSNYFILPRINNQIEGGNLDLNFYKENINLKLDLNSEKQSLVNTLYPSKFSKAFYGILSAPKQVLINDSLLITSFLGDESLYCFNLIQNTSKSYSCRSSFQKKNIIPLNNKNTAEIEMIDLFQNYISNPVYGEMSFNKNINLYLRLFYKELPEINPHTNKPYVISEKPAILQFIDENFNIVNEKAFKIMNFVSPPICYSKNYFMTFNINSNFQNDTTWVIKSYKYFVK